MQESHLIAMSKIQRSNTKLLAILHKLPNFEVGKQLDMDLQSASYSWSGCKREYIASRDKAVTKLDRPLQDSSSGTRSRTRWSTGRRQDPISGSSL